MLSNRTFIINQQGIGFAQGKAREIRLAVFVKEQEIPMKLEIDDLDERSWHFVLIKNNQPVSTARVFEEGKKELHIGRVATLKEFRKQGLAGGIFLEIEKFAKLNNFSKLVLDAQLTAKSFYEKINYIPEGEIFLDADIEHVRMTKEII